VTLCGHPVDKAAIRCPLAAAQPIRRQFIAKRYIFSFLVLKIMPISESKNQNYRKCLWNQCFSKLAHQLLIGVM
jgi:hypothetical protein